jgi:hypothetical protein
MAAMAVSVAVTGISGLLVALSIITFSGLRGQREFFMTRGRISSTCKGGPGG